MAAFLTDKALRHERRPVKDFHVDRVGACTFMVHAKGRGREATATLVLDGATFVAQGFIGEERSHVKSGCESSSG